MRDVGHPDQEADTLSPFGLAPDGQSVAFVINRGDPASNTICRALVTLSLQSGRLAVLDRGGELPLVRGNYRGMLVTTGFPDAVQPQWSPDGRRIAYLKRTAGRTGVWLAAVNGGGAQQVSHADSDIEDVAWRADGAALIYHVRMGIVSGERALDTEAKGGWHYDARTTPDVSWRPNLMISDIPLVPVTIDLARNIERPATAPEATALAAAFEFGLAREVHGAGGLRAGTDRDGANPLGPNRIWVATAAGEVTRCGLPECSKGIRYLWWLPNGELLWLRREGWNNELTALYRWRPGKPRAARVLQTTDTLIGCAPTAATLICGRETSLSPRQIVAIDLATGRQRSLLDLNPEFAGLRVGKVERLRLRSDRGLPAWADLVLPPGYRGKRPLPLVVVVYYSRGFLRGGVGDEYPILPLAARGYAVLSIERPEHVAAAMPGVHSWDEVNAAGLRDWAERKSLLSVVLAGIDATVARGVADPKRVGLTGLSDGATNVEYALINTRRFAAAVVGSCCDSPVTNLALGGPAWADWNRETQNYPGLIAEDDQFWTKIGLVRHARTLRTPLLMQLADRESILALETFAALREGHSPVDLFVFPDEYHNKWQPAHRLASYDRTMDWFDFWLQDLEDGSSLKRTQYDHWRKLRASQTKPAHATSPVPLAY